MISVFIGSKSGIESSQLENRIDIQLRLESELSHPDVSFRYIEVQPPSNLNRDLSVEEHRALDLALDKNFLIGFEFPHLWSGRDVDPCMPETMKDLLEIATIASELGVDYLFTNPGDLSGASYNYMRWRRARDAHLEAIRRIREIHPCPGIENANPIRHLNSGIVCGFFGMVPEDLCLFDFVVLDIAHAQFTVNHFRTRQKMESVSAVGRIHKRSVLSLDDYVTILGDKIQVVHVADSIGLGSLDKEGLRLDEGEGGCKKFISQILEKRCSPIRFVAEPSPIPYGLNYHSLGEVMYLEEKKIFEICVGILRKEA